MRQQIARTLAESLGIIYLGSSIGMRKIDDAIVDVMLHTFRDPQTTTTLALFDDELNTSRLTEKVVSSRLTFSTCKR
jgi:hypothetical protein